jgi:penicillin-insensitive murein DD-endopeptidase
VFTRDIDERYFDLARNWELVKALITDAEVEVERIFVSDRIRRWLLAYARHIGEPEDLVRHAGIVLMRPRNAETHNDHMHVRVACSADDLAHGRCRNQSAPRPYRARRWHSRVPCPAPGLLRAGNLSSAL